MEKLEEKSKKRGKRKNLQKIILRSVALAGVLSVALVAPNVLSAIERLGLTKSLREKEYISSSASRLKKRGLLEFKNGYYSLTLEGRKILRRFEFSDYKLNTPKKWDRKWRVVIFDIPEKKKKIRNHITLIFRQAGFERLQDSVWIYPYDCEDIIGLLKTDFGVGKYILYMIVEELENDRHLREEFDLK